MAIDLDVLTNIEPNVTCRIEGVDEVIQMKVKGSALTQARMDKATKDNEPNSLLLSECIIGWNIATPPSKEVFDALPIHVTAAMMSAVIKSFTPNEKTSDEL